MSLRLTRLVMAHAACSRLMCGRISSFQSADEKSALAELRSRGWSHSKDRTLCPDHQERLGES